MVDSRFMKTVERARAAAGLILALLMAIESLHAQEPHTLRYGFQPGRVYQYQIEMGFTFTAGETRNQETIRGVEALVVVERNADTITILPVEFGFRLTDYLVHGEDLATHAARDHGRGDPFFGTPLRYEAPSDVAPNPFLGRLAARFSETGAAPPEAMVPRFWGVLTPLGEWLQNYFPVMAYPWALLPIEEASVGQSWELPFPGMPDTFRYVYDGHEAGDIPCDVILGSIDVGGQAAAQWGSPEGVEVRSTLCLATEGGFPVIEEVRAKRIGEIGESEQSIRAVLVGHEQLDEESLEVVRQAARGTPPEVRPAESDSLEGLLDRPAPELEIRDAVGSSRHLSDFVGRVVVMHFWVPWLSISAQTLVTLLDVSKEFAPEDVEMLPIVTEDEASRRLEIAAVILEEIDPSAPVLRPNEEDLAAYHANSIVPVTVIVDREGIIRAAFAGYLPSDVLRGSIREILDGNS
ncbi:MAG: TlpA family protein disulfide reductase [Gemmatimonadota bacterium]